MTVRQTTDLRVLPQPAALESVPADNPGVGTKRGTDAGHVPASGGQHGRGETGHTSGVASTDAGRKAIHHDSGAAVLVLDRRHKPLMPTTERRGRKLLATGRAVVHRAYPFTIRIKDRSVEDSVLQPLGLGIDPGSKHTGLALFTVVETVDTTTGEITTDREGVWLGQLDHRGRTISMKMTSRAQLRRGRRSRNLRYRAPRFLNRHPAKCDSCGSNAKRDSRWCRPCKAMPRKDRNTGLRGTRLAPSLMHRIHTITSWVDRLTRWAPVTSLHMELVRFDLQLMQNPAISGVEYQQGTLAGYELREWMFEKFGRKCVYCDATDVPLNRDHVHPKSRGGSDRASNAAPACVPCNKDKDNQWVHDFLAHDPKRLAWLLSMLKKPLADAAAVNATGFALHRVLVATGLPVETGTGGRTKFNRSRNNLPKTHALDALCVGAADRVSARTDTTLVIGCTGRGSYQRAHVNKYGFPRGKGRGRVKVMFGYQTGDMVKAVVPTGKKAGIHIGRVGVRATGSFNVGRVEGIHHRHVRLIQRADGYTYDTRKEAAA